MPSSTVSYKQKSLIVPPVLALSLSLSSMSCSNELNHISDAVEDHEHGQKLCYGAIYSFLSCCLFPNLSLSSLFSFLYKSPKTTASFPPFLHECNAVQIQQKAPSSPNVHTLPRQITHPTCSPCISGLP